MSSNWENIVINVVVGIAGAISETIVQMTIADLFFTHQRASANALYLFTVTTGTFLAPVAAGASAASQGWRWIWWWCAIFLGANLILVIFFFEETKFIIKITGEDRRESFSQEETFATDEKNLRTSTEMKRVRESFSETSKKSFRQRLALLTTTPETPLVRHAYQPFLLLITFPAVTYTALMYGANLAWFSCLSITSSTYLLSPPYNFGAWGVGLFSLAPFTGSVIAAFFGGPLTDWYILKMAKRNGGVFEPEMRLHLALSCLIATPAGMFCYGFGLTNVSLECPLHQKLETRT